MRFWRIIFAYCTIVIVFGSSVGQSIIFAAISSWTQSDWSGSSYSSKTGVDGQANQITLTPTSNWYNTSWKYRQSVAVANTSGSTLTNFQIPIVLDTSTLITAKKMNGSCTDLRVTDATGSALPYWIATAPTADTCGTNGSTTTKVWVKASSISTSGETFYIYYGNAAGASESSGAGVFTTFADFTTGSSLPSGWSETVIGSTGSVSVGSGVLSVVNTDGADVWTNKYGGTHAFRDTKVSGSFVAETLITSQTGTTPPISTWAKSGISIQNARTSGGGNGQAFIIATPGNGIRFQYQSTAGELCVAGSCPTVVGPNINEPATGGTFSFPTLLKLVKDGSNNVSGYNYDTAQSKWIKEGNTFAPWGVVNDQYISLITTGHVDAGLHDTVTATFAFFYTRAYTDPATEPTAGTPASEQTVYGSSGTLTSSVFDTGQASDFGTLSFTVTTPVNTTATVKVRTSSSTDPTMTNATDFGSCTAISTGSDISTNSCVRDGDRYIQYQVTLTSSDNLSTPTFRTFSLEYGQSPTPGPATTVASNTPAPQGCSLSAPTGIPDIYELDPEQKSVTLYFTPVSGSDRYFIRYGTDTSANQYAVDFVHTDQSGAVKYTIEKLHSGKPYYFSVRAGNGCAAGEWSGVVSSTTTISSYIPPMTQVVETLEKTIEATKEITVVSSHLTDNKSDVCSYAVSFGDSVWSIAKDKLRDATRFADIKQLNGLTTNALRVGQELKLPCDEKQETLISAKEEVQQIGSMLDVKVIADNGKPVTGATVTLHSNVQTATTDSEGVAHFENVEKGDHRVLLSYNGYKGEQKLTIDGDKNNQTLTLQVHLDNGFSSLTVKVVIGILTGIIAYLGSFNYLLLKRRLNNSRMNKNFIRTDSIK